MDKGLRILRRRRMHFIVDACSITYRHREGTAPVFLLQGPPLTMAWAHHVMYCTIMISSAATKCSLKIALPTDCSGSWQWRRTASPGGMARKSDREYNLEAEFMRLTLAHVIGSTWTSTPLTDGTTTRRCCRLPSFGCGSLQVYTQPLAAGMGL